MLCTNDIRVLVRSSKMKMANKQLHQRPGVKWTPYSLIHKPQPRMVNIVTRKQVQGDRE